MSNLVLTNKSEYGFVLRCYGTTDVYPGQSTILPADNAKYLANTYPGHLEICGDEKFAEDTLGEGAVTAGMAYGEPLVEVEPAVKHNGYNIPKAETKPVVEEETKPVVEEETKPVVEEETKPVVEEETENHESPAFQTIDDNEPAAEEAN